VIQVYQLWIFLLAEENLFKVRSTTINSWGKEQATVYAQTMETALLNLALCIYFDRERSDIYLVGSSSFQSLIFAVKTLSINVIKKQIYSLVNLL
jgi:hypothetical protein